MTISWMIDKYFASPKFKERSKRTQENYRTYANTIKSSQAKSGQLLGQFPVDVLNVKMVQKYIDQREHKIAANREIEFLSAVYGWAVRRLNGVESNPCYGVEYNKETPRDRYVTDEEYRLVYDLALKGRCKYLPIVMEIIYLCRARPGEAYLMKKSAIRENGLFLDRGKGSENEITLWSDRLETAILTAMNYWPDGEYLMYSERGMPIKKDAFDLSRRRLMNKALESGLQEDFTFHDLKAKGVSDHSEKFGGHRSEKMKAVYDRVPGLVKSTR